MKKALLFVITCVLFGAIIYPVVAAEPEALVTRDIQAVMKTILSTILWLLIAIALITFIYGLYKKFSLRKKLVETQGREQLLKEIKHYDKIAIRGLVTAVILFIITLLVKFG